MPACAVRSPASDRRTSLRRAQFLSLDLAHRVARQLFEHHDAARTLVGREALARERDKLALVQRPRAGRDDEGGPLLAPALAGQPRDRDLSDRRMRLQHELDLTRINVESTRDDQLLQPAPDGERAVVADLTHVAGAQEAVGGERLLRRLRVAPVAVEHLAAFEQHLARLAELHLHARERVADSAGLARPVVRIRDHDAAFGDAVALDWRLPEQL